MSFTTNRPASNHEPKTKRWENTGKMTVYVAKYNGSTKTYHTSTDCSQLRSTSKTFERKEAEIQKLGWSICPTCAGTVAKQPKQQRPSLREMLR